MPGIPSRDALAALLRAANDVAAVPVLGFSRDLGDGRAWVLYAHAQGMGAHILPFASMPQAMVPGDGPRHGSADEIDACPERAIEWHFRFLGVRRLLSLAVPGTATPISLWIGFSSPDAVAPDQLQTLTGIASASSRTIEVVESEAAVAERLRRLEQTAGLLPALTAALDVREIFGWVSTVSKTVLPHDMVLLGLSSEDLTQLTLYAETAHTSQLGTVFRAPYAPEFVRAWDFDIVDDLEHHALERDRPPRRLGMQSIVRAPIRFGDRLVGGLGFASLEPARYTGADIAIVRRLCEYVGIGLSHHELAEQGRKAAVLQERAATFELLEGLLNTLTGVLDIRQVFARVSEIASRVLPHDAIAIAEIIDEGTRARIHASLGLGDLPQPADFPLNDRSLYTDRWDYRLVEDLREDPNYAHGPAARAGMRSSLFAAIRFEGGNFGGLSFYAREPRRYTKDDALLARRIADHVALALSHQRLAEHARRNEELRARAAQSDLLDEVLAGVTSTGSLPEVFDRISSVSRRVLSHDALVLTVLLPDGQKGRVYASTMRGVRPPEIIDVPPAIRGNPGWEFDIVQDLTADPVQQRLWIAQQGYRSALRVPIRLDNEFVAGLSFLARPACAYSQADVPIAKRIADRLALSFSRERNAALLKRADEAAERASHLEARVRALTDELDARTGYRRVVGDSAEWRQVLTQATQVAATDATVLLLGESGTGKEVVARFIHRGSRRANSPFVALNCAALPEQLLEAELFGYERGAYTGATQSKPGQLEQASGGTLFLDEVGEMSLPAQAKFLRVLQEREFQRLGGTRVLRTDARVVAATNRDLARAISHGQFREDLYYRLNVFAIRLPALRERTADVLPLSDAFLAEIGRGLGRPPAGISRDARTLLIEYGWPGNVRELRNILERAAILCEGGLITAEHLALNAAAPPPRPGRAPEVPAPVVPTSASDLHSMERAMIEQALQTARYNKSKAAKALGLTRQQLYVRMHKYGLE
jgi:transcriptional regulator with GAF, ATPase, and Fis domain